MKKRDNGNNIIVLCYNILPVDVCLAKRFFSNMSILVLIIIIAWLDLYFKTQYIHTYSRIGQTINVDFIFRILILEYDKISDT